MSTKVPPDGGWGWVIAIASAINALSTIPILQVFGLVFKDSFVALNLTATDTAVIININLAVGMMLGLITGPLLKAFGYRKIAIMGSIIYTLGITSTAFADSFSLIIICYGILTSIGMGTTLSAFSLALNTYFTEKRDRAVALTMTLTGLGPILMPPLTSLLLSVYGTQGTVLLFGAYSLHSLIGSLLLQPVKWHMKSMPTSDDHLPKINNKNPELLMTNKEETPNHYTEEKANIYSSKVTLNNYQRTRKITTSSIDHDIDVASIYGFDTSPPRKTSMDVELNACTYSAKNMEMTGMNTSSKTNLHENSQYLKKQNLAKSIDSINLGSSLKLFEELAPTNKKLSFIDDNYKRQSIVEEDALLANEVDKDSTEENCNDDESKEESVFRRIVRQISNLYDLDLLRDPIYVNIMLGMSIAIFAEANFSMLTPFILAEMDIGTAKIATIMSVIAIVDLISRCVSPFLREWLHQSSRIMYLLSLFLLAISRTSLIFTDSFTSVLIVAIGLGFAKGIRSVYMALVVPSHVPIQKLPNASGIQMMTNGMLLMCVGPIFGLIRDKSGSYTACIILINSMTTVTILMWTIEMIITRRKSVKRNPTLQSSPVA